MGKTAQHYLIFQTANGFCGIAWNETSITRLQLPTRTADGAERLLLRRAPGAEPGAPTPAVVQAIDAVKRYFAGEKTDFSDFSLDLSDQDALFRRIYAAARQVGWGQTTTYGALAEELGAGPEAARCRRGHGQEPGAADHSLPQGPGGRRQGRRFFSAGRRHGQASHARARGRPGRAAATGAAVVRVLKSGSAGIY